MDNSFNEVRSTKSKEEFATDISGGREIDLFCPPSIHLCKQTLCKSANPYVWRVLYIQDCSCEYSLRLYYHIKRTYVTKDEMKDLKTDVNKSISKLQTDVEQIKDTCLTKRDFYNAIAKVENDIKEQNKLILELIKETNAHG